MKQLASWWKRLYGPTTVSLPSAWPISAPFIVNVQFDGHETSPDAAAEKWLRLIDAVAGPARQISFEGDDLLACAAAPRILDRLDACGACFHVETDGHWADPPAIIRRLRPLKRLGSLRWRVAADDQGLANLHQAVAAGLTVWACLAGDRPLHDMVLKLAACGVAGIALRRSAGPITVAVCREAEMLHREGYSIAFDDCPPAGCDTGLPCRCSGGYGSCSVDGQGRVRICRHDAISLGSLSDGPLETLWATPALQERRRAHGGHCGLCGAISAVEAAVSKSAGDEVRALDPDLAPVGLYRVRSEPFGAILIREFEFIALAHEGARIAAAFDGTRSLANLERAFGPDVTTLAFSLFCRKWLRFRRRSSEQRPAAADIEVEFP